MILSILDKMSINNFVACGIFNARDNMPIYTKIFLQALSSIVDFDTTGKRSDLEVQ